MSIVTVNSRNFDGSIRRSWTCRLVDRSGKLLLLVGEFDSDVEHNQLGLIRRGTLSYEYYWTDKWFNVFRFEEPDGTLRNFYCNINCPPVFRGNVLDYVDLDLDVLVWPDMSVEVLDREDLERNAQLFSYSDELTQKIEASLSEVINLARKEAFPFNQAAGRLLRLNS